MPIFLVMIMHIDTFMLAKKDEEANIETHRDDRCALNNIKVGVPSASCDNKNRPVKGYIYTRAYK